MKNRTFIYLVCICLMSWIGVKGSHAQLDVQQLTEQQGLGNNTINGIHQDRKGFLWIATDIGLVRYDGNSFHVYKLSRKGGGEPISVTDIKETEDRFLWLECKGGTLACFDKRQDRYVPVRWEDGTSPEEVLQLYSTGNTLYATLTDGLYALSAKSDGKVIVLGKQALVPIEKASGILYGQGHTLYTVNPDKHLLVHDAQTGETRSLDCAEWGIQPGEITHISVYGDYLFVCGEFEGIICCHLKENTFRQLKVSNQYDYRQPNIREISYLKDNRFAVSNRRFIYELKFEGDDYIRSPYEIVRQVQYERQYEKLIRNRISKLYYDKDNHVLWIGTYGNGLVRQNISHTYAYPIALNENIYHINDIVQDAEGYVWLGTRKHGILRSTTACISAESRFELWEGADKDGSYHLQKDRNGYIWIGSEQGTIQKLNPDTRELTTVAFPDSVRNPAEEGCVQNLFMNSRNRLWIATETSVGVYDENTGEWLVFKNYLKPYGKVTCIVEDAEGIMYLGTEKGVFEANVPLDIPNKINMTGGFEQESGLTPDEVLSMHVTNTNQILVSYPDKIIRLEKNKVINHIVLQEDIPYGHITCMIDDRNGNTWLGSNESVISIHNKTNTYFAFPLSGNNPVVCRLNDSKLLWGNMPDLVFFDPIKLKDLPRKKVHITDIEVNARKMVLPGLSIHDANEIELTQGDHVKFLFSKLNYNAVQNKTAYRMLPVDTVWKENSRNEIVLDDLEAGNYVLEIKPVYPVPGGEEVTSLKLRVVHHWAFSTWTLIGYACLIASGSILVYHYLRKRRKRRAFYASRQQQLEEELQVANEMKEHEKMVHQIRDNIQVSIAKDLRTPLSIITNSLKEVMENKDVPYEVQQKFKLAHRNSLYIQEACDQFIQIYKPDLCRKKLEVSSCPIYRITDSVLRSAREIISASPIHIDYGDTRERAEIWVDFAKIEFTVKNMLTNAFRRVHYAGNIQCSVDRENIDGKEYCVFRIIDDGKNAETLIEQGYILGHDLMESIARLHHGKLTVARKGEEGTESALYVPMGKGHFEQDDYVTFVEKADVQVPEEGSVVVPVRQMPEVDEAEAPSASQSKQQVLIVEAHKDTRAFLKLQFANDYAVHLAKNGQEGVDVARKVSPDLIISEVELPLMDGFELTRLIKEDADMCHIPIILVTTLTNNEDIIKGMELGAEDYIRKPYDIEVLKSKVKRIIKNRIELKKAYTKLLIPVPETTEGDADSSDAGKDGMEDPLIAKIIRIVNDNIQNEDFSVKKLAEMLNMSQPTLYRKVKQLTNFTLIEIVRGVRLKRAAELLRSRKCNVQEAAEAVGYNDIPTFRKHFVDLYGVTPSAFSKEEDKEKK